ncbi:MAG: cellulase family glycosylhydrolase [Deltaproteobacteria bacterium]|nr:cellulase family glycosylhydrolase [Deltaproteobacteria bacterium]
MRTRLIIKSHNALVILALAASICNCEAESDDNDIFGRVDSGGNTLVPYAGTTSVPTGNISGGMGGFGSEIADSGPVGQAGSEPGAGNETGVPVAGSATGGGDAVASGGVGGGDAVVSGGFGGEVAGSGGTTGGGESDGVLIDGTCWPICSSSSSDPDEQGHIDGWGWEFAQSCVVRDSDPYNSGTPCTIDRGTGGAGGQGGSGEIPTKQGYCRPVFTSGVNVAWFNFAQDIPNPDMGKFNDLYNNIKTVGGTVVRWWFHTTGSVTPGYDNAGLAKAIPQQHIDDMRRICDAAQSAGVMLVVSLWSFDMLQNYIDANLRQNNRKLLTDDSARQAYIDNYLTPLVVALKGHKGIYAWEIFNEPEGMTPLGWTNEKVEMDVIQKNVNWMADAIRAADPDVLVTNSAWTFISNANVGGYKNYYSDAELVRVGGRANGTLDFYQVHYYDNWGRDNSEVSPFAHDASFWNIDKPITIGEFWVLGLVYSGDYKPDDMYTLLYEKGYSGAWAWQYANIDQASAPGWPSQVDGRWPAMQKSMQNLKTVAGADIECQ